MYVISLLLSPKHTTMHELPLIDMMETEGRWPLNKKKPRRTNNRDKKRSCFPVKTWPLCHPAQLMPGCCLSVFVQDYYTCFDLAHGPDCLTEAWSSLACGIITSKLQRQPVLLNALGQDEQCFLIADTRRQTSMNWFGVCFCVFFGHMKTKMVDLLFGSSADSTAVTRAVLV